MRECGEFLLLSSPCGAAGWTKKLFFKYYVKAGICRIILSLLSFKKSIHKKLSINSLWGKHFQHETLNHKHKQCSFFYIQNLNSTNMKIHFVGHPNCMYVVQWEYDACRWDAPEREAWLVKHDIHMSWNKLCIFPLILIPVKRWQNYQNSFISLLFYNNRGKVSIVFYQTFKVTCQPGSQIDMGCDRNILFISWKHELT